MCSDLMLDGGASRSARQWHHQHVDRRFVDKLFGRRDEGAPEILMMTTKHQIKFVVADGLGDFIRQIATGNQCMSDGIRGVSRQRIQLGLGFIDNAVAGLHQIHIDKAGIELRVVHINVNE